MIHVELGDVPGEGGYLEAPKSTVRGLPPPQKFFEIIRTGMYLCRIFHFLKEKVGLLMPNLFWSGTVEQWTERVMVGMRGNRHFYHSRSQIIGGRCPYPDYLGEGGRPRFRRLCICLYHSYSPSIGMLQNNGEAIGPPCLNNTTSKIYDSVLIVKR